MKLQNIIHIMEGDIMKYLFFVMAISLFIMGCDPDSGKESPPASNPKGKSETTKESPPANNDPTGTGETITEEIEEINEEIVDDGGTDDENVYSISLFSNDIGDFLLVDSENRTFLDLQVYSTRRRNVYLGVAEDLRNSRRISFPKIKFSFSDLFSLGEKIYQIYKLVNPENSFFEELFNWAAGEIIFDLGKSAYNDLKDSSQSSSIKDNVARRKKILKGRRWDMRPW